MNAMTDRFSFFRVARAFRVSAVRGRSKAWLVVSLFVLMGASLVALPVHAQNRAPIDSCAVDAGTRFPLPHRYMIDKGAARGCHYGDPAGVEGAHLDFLINPAPEAFSALVQSTREMGGRVEPVAVPGCKAEMLVVETDVPTWHPMYVIAMTCPLGYFIVDNEGSGVERAGVTDFARRAARTQFDAKYLRRAK